MDTNPTILVVESEESAREILSQWLMAAGFVVMPCPGPLYPDYLCIGAQGAQCPLAVGSDLVLLDLELASDYAMTGTPARELLTYYLNMGKPVIARTDPGDGLVSRPEDGLFVLSKDAPRTDLIDAVRGALRPARASA